MAKEQPAIHSSIGMLMRLAIQNYAQIIKSRSKLWKAKEQPIQQTRTTKSVKHIQTSQKQCLRSSNEGKGQQHAANRVETRDRGVSRSRRAKFGIEGSKHSEDTPYLINHLSPDLVL